MKTNTFGYPFLDQAILNDIFTCVYGEPELVEEIHDRQKRAFIEMLLAVQQYNFRFRGEQLEKLFPILEETVGPLDTRSEGAALWTALALAIKDIYGMRPETIRQVLRKVTVRK